jgi:pantoate--beta-alanine ligase
MILYKQASSLTTFLATQKNTGIVIGFVPTMGALHQGHLSLLAKAKEDCGLVVCSIFVNPTQFNNPDDFKKYPITIEKDIELLIGHGCDVLFLPSAEEIYPPRFKAEHYDLGELENVLEGVYRPGHFQGVCQVVDRLLQIVDPSKLYVGQKDYQQCQVIQRLLAITNRMYIDLVIAPTIREEDGLAMSSRNLRLKPEQRVKAVALYKELSRAKSELRSLSPEQIKASAIEQLSKDGFKVDYFEIADAASLTPASDPAKPSVALVAAYLDDIRLIDNLPLN